MKEVSFSRRKVLRLAVVAAAGVVLTACGEAPTVTPTPTRLKNKPTVPPLPSPNADASFQPKTAITPVASKPEIMATPIPTPTEKVTALTTREVDIITKTDKKIVFNPKLLELAGEQIQDSGLGGKIKAIIIVNPNDPILDTEEYPGGVIKYRPKARIIPSANPEEGVFIYLANAQLSESDIIHEIGHAADPTVNKSIHFGLQEFNDDYWSKYYYQNYLRRLPFAIKTGSLLTSYIFYYEKNIVEGACFEVGKKAWENFFSAFESFPFGSTQFFIPDGELQTLSNSLPENSLQKQAVEWQMREIDRLKSKGQTPEIKGFTYDTWGRYLLRRYHENPDIIKQNLPQLYPEIKKIALQAFWLARQEVWADLWVERVLRPDNARQLYPFGVQTQEKLIKFLKTQQKYQNKAF